MKNEALLHDEIATELHTLKEMEVGTDSYKVTVDGVTKLIDRAIEIDKLNIECKNAEMKLKQMEEDRAIEIDKLNIERKNAEMKLKQMEEDNQDRIIKNRITLAGILIPAGLTVWGIIKSIKFEETGTFTTIVGRGLINKILPKK